MQEAIRKAAVLVGTLDPSSADKLLDCMDADMAQQVRNAVMQLDSISDSEESSIVADFLRSGRPGTEPPSGGVELDASLAAKIAAAPPEGVEAAKPAAPVEPFRFLNDATTDSLANYLRQESPQIIAVVLAHLPAQRAADVVKRLRPPLQVEVLRRVAELDRSDTAAILDLEESLREVLEDEIRAAKNRCTGMATVASILDAAGPERGQLRANVERFDRELASGLPDPGQPNALATGDRLGDHREIPVTTPRTSAVPSEPEKIPSDQSVGLSREPRSGAAGRAKRPTVAASPTAAFEALWVGPSREVVALLHRIPREVLLLALAGASPTLLNHLFRGLPSKVARGLRREMTRLGPLRLSDIEEAQRRIVAFASESVEEAGPTSDGFAAAA